MPDYLLIFIAALLFSYGATPLVQRLAGALGVVDVPGPRKSHAGAVPLLGGVAIYTAFIASLLLFGGPNYVTQLINIFIGATLVSFLGVLDDSRGMRPIIKLAGQGLAASLLVASGIEVAFLRNPLLNVTITLLWIIGITNALNLLDNMDGLSSGITAVAGGFFFLLAAINGQFLVASLSAAITGACIGFLRYNFNPARIFMGDTGSLFLGFVLAAIGIKVRFPSNSDLVTWMIPVIVLGLPIFDTVLVVVSRLRRGLNPLTTPGRDHTSHRLVQLGMSQRGAVVTLYLVGLVLGIAALVIMNSSIVQAYVIGGIVAIIGLASLVFLGKVPVYR